ncbi:MAG: amidohydrolase family protein [Chloroflexi bacterium]|nr:amidohydrolase family protein [Chloroflexota bacterium]
MILDCHLHYRKYPDHLPGGDANAMVRSAKAMGQTEAQLRQRADRSIERLLREMKESGTDKGIALGLKALTTNGSDIPNEDIAEAVKPHAGKLYWGAAVVLTDASAPVEAEHCIKNLGAVAIGEVGPMYEHVRLDDPRCFRVYEVARSYDVPVMIHAGIVGASMAGLKNGGDLSALDEVCLNFPELKVILCHFGHPYFHEATDLMAKHANLYSDISGVPGRARKPSAGVNAPPVFYPFAHAYEPFLIYFSTPARNHNKLLWATDVSVPKEHLEGFRNINPGLKQMGYPTIPEDRMEKILHENWKPVFTKIKA